MKIFKFSVVFLCITCAIGFVVAATMIIKQDMTDMSINDSISTLANNVKYKNPAKTESENILSIDKISTSTSVGFYNEIIKQFPDYKITQYKNIKNSEFIDKIYDSLINGMPVICQYAAVENESKNESDELTETEEQINSPAWTMQYCIITEMDIPGDKITVNNPYGYTGIYKIKDFLKATRFESYENMEFYLKLGFALEIFTKNTVYILEKPEEIK